MKRPTVNLPDAPKVSDPFLLRVCKALGMKPTELAEAIGVPYADIHKMLAPRHIVVEIDRDETWWKISEIIDLRIGLLMAARHELQKALQQDRAKRSLRVERHLERDKKPSPRR